MSGKIIETKQIALSKDGKQLYDAFSCLQSGTKIIRAIESVTAKEEIYKPFNESLSKLINCDIKILNRSDFENSINLKNVAPDVVVGTDILVLAYYGIKNVKFGAVISFGTVYFCVVFDRGQIINVLFAPSIVRGLSTISSITTIACSAL